MLSQITGQQVTTERLVALERQSLSETVSVESLVEPAESATTRVLGDYEIFSELGRGGMGVVFRARQQSLDREVAVKVLPREKSTPEAVANFSREMKTLARLDHPNLVRAYDAGQDGNVHFLVTEYVSGMDLRKMVRAQGRLVGRSHGSRGNGGRYGGRFRGTLCL